MRHRPAARGLAKRGRKERTAFFQPYEEAEQILSTPVAAAPHPAAPQPGPAAAPAQPPTVLRGVPKVADTAILVFPDGIAHLQGVAGEKGELAHQLERYIRGREVVCQETEPGTAQYRCDLGDIDVGEAVVLNGAGRVAADASGRLLGAGTKGPAGRPGRLARVADRATLVEAIEVVRWRLPITSHSTGRSRLWPDTISR